MFSILKNIKNVLSKIEVYLEKNNKKSENELSQEELLKKELFNTKEAETHAGFVNGWLNTKLEKDKSILTLSAAGIGVLVTFFNSIDPSNILIIINYIFALFFFVVALMMDIYIFGANAKYLQKIIHKKPAKSMAGLDYILSGSFIIGLVLTISLSFLIIYEKKDKSDIKSLESKYIELLEAKIKLLERSNNMTKENTNVNIESIEMKKKSFDDAKNLYPVDEDKKKEENTQKEKKDEDK
jgi:preprotein translocase subunit SecG